MISSKGLRGDEAAVGQIEIEEEAIICEKCEDGEPQEEVGAPMIARRPGVPTKVEINAHYPIHIELRDWCRYCVEGKGVSRHHEMGKEEEEAVGVTVCVDYCFWTPEEFEGEMDAILVGYEREKMGLWTMVVEAKGPTPSSTEWLSGYIEEAGYNGVSITLKSDQEESIKSLKKAVSIKRTSATAMIDDELAD